MRGSVDIPKSFSAKVSSLIAFLLALNLFLINNSYGQSTQVRGFIYDKKSAEALIFTPVYLKGTNFGVNTDVNGYFSLSKMPPGNYTLIATGVGYDTISEEITVSAGQILNKKLFLAERTTEVALVEVIANKQKTERLTTPNISKVSVTAKEIKALPSIGGEPDLAQYLQVVPGIVSTGDQGGQLYFRGGAPVQNLVLMDGMVVYNPFHSVGLYSVFETELIKNTDVYTAGFNSEYGGRTSGVMDVKTIDGNKNRLSGRVGLNPFTGRAMIEGPLVKGKDGGSVSFVLNARTSFLDKTSKSIYTYANDGNGLPFKFSDFFGKVTLAAGNGSKISFQGFNFTDEAKLGGQNNFKWNNFGLGSNFLILPSTGTALITGNVAYSTYGIDISEITSVPRSSAVSSFNANIDFTYYLNSDELKYGIGTVLNTSKFSTLTPTNAKFDIEGSNTELFGYVKYRYVSDRLVLEPGFRFQYYSSISVLSPEPRLGAKFNLTDKIRLKAGAGLYSQNLLTTSSQRDVVALFNGYITSPDLAFTTSVPGKGTPSNNLQYAKHAVVGVEIDLGNHVDINIEPYIKNWNQLTSVNPEQLFSTDPLYIVETSIAKGIDFIAKYTKKSLFIQLGYSLAKVDRTYGDITYPTSWDRRHNFNFLSSYTFGKKKNYEVDARYNFGSGFPFTQTISNNEFLPFGTGIDQNLSTGNGNYTTNYGTLSNYNQGRLPNYHRFDVSIKRKQKLGENANLEIAASVTNATNRANLFYYDRVAGKRINQLPILPTLGVSLQF